VKPPDVNHSLYESPSGPTSADDPVWPGLRYAVVGAGSGGGAAARRDSTCSFRASKTCASAPGGKRSTACASKGSPPYALVSPDGLGATLSFLLPHANGCPGRGHSADQNSRRSSPFLSKRHVSAGRPMILPRHRPAAKPKPPTGGEARSWQWGGGWASAIRSVVSSRGIRLSAKKLAKRGSTGSAAIGSAT